MDTTAKRLGSSVFNRTKDDSKPGLSIQDKQFLEIMDKNVSKNCESKWEAPLPFREERNRLPNNCAQPLNRALTPNRNLRNNPEKKEHFITFISQIYDQKHAELAPPVKEGEEVRYLPIFGVYHPQKPGQIRGVFDSSALYKGTSLNKLLLSGPDLINSLLGILLRFRKELIAFVADIQQMFYCFAVKERHQNYLRFLWYRDNDPENELMKYRMRVHVFGNSLSPTVACYGLRLTAKASQDEFGSDVRQFIEEDFYVDDGLSARPTISEAVDLVKRTQSQRSNGKIRLQKIASNSPDVMLAFNPEDRAKDLKKLDLSSDSLPVQDVLGLVWNLDTDTFTFTVSDRENPFTKRGILSTINSLYDPLGFVAPIVVQGKTFLRSVITEVDDWDDPIPAGRNAEWTEWMRSLESLKEIHILRTYVGISSQNSQQRVTHLLRCLEQAIAAVAYLLTTDEHGDRRIGFVLGKSKVAPMHGRTIPRLELFAAVLGVELYAIIMEHLKEPICSTHFHTHSKVTLAYICNETRRFHIYVTNRVERIRRLSSPSQWSYVPTDKNPADLATRPLPVGKSESSDWLNGPTYLLEDKTLSHCTYELVDPEEDKEVRQLSHHS